MLENLIPHIVNGLSLGLLFALIALGFTLIVGLMEVINLAHGSLFTLGAYIALTIINPSVLFSSASEPDPGSLFGRYLLALVFAPLLVAALGMLLEIMLRRTYGKDPLYGLLLTFGAALVIEEAIRIFWGSKEQSIMLPSAIPLPFVSNFEMTGIFLIGESVILFRYRIFACAFATFLILIVWLFIEKTKYGAIIKAGAHDSEMVQALGINLARLRLFVFAFGTALAALAGIVLCVDSVWGLRPHVGVDAVIPAFLIVVIGGVGSFWGSVIAGILVGLATGLTGAYADAWQNMAMYILLIVVVSFRGRGLFGKASALDT
ncbi:MAG: branched-chain amino acid ABC transporter permease [Planctomycetota bacterium]|nr:branched-chain amino acid ABC transporter permease [Planctomycetota bacterium]MDA1138814.1 branched-chain amino acid ABC transporter permease [Planctomycetota bacterium]